MPSESSTLQTIGVTFILPKGDDRDHDTVTSIDIKQGAVLIAENLDIAPGQHFDDPGIYGPFPIGVVTKVTKANYRNSTTHMHIQPNGHDRWITDIHIAAKFDDGETLQSSSGVRIVSQDAQDTSFQNV